MLTTQWLILKRLSPNEYSDATQGTFTFRIQLGVTSTPNADILFEIESNVATGVATIRTTGSLCDETASVIRFLVSIAHGHIDSNHCLKALLTGTFQ